MSKRQLGIFVEHTPRVGQILYNTNF